MTLVNIDWNSLRPLNDSLNLAFEELCCQLAASEKVQLVLHSNAKVCPMREWSVFGNYRMGKSWPGKRSSFLNWVTRSGGSWMSQWTLRWINTAIL